MNDTVRQQTGQKLPPPLSNGLDRQKSLRVFLWGVVALALAAALFSAARRWKTETRNRRVEVVLDMGELRSLSVTEGKPLGEVLRAFRKAGATSVAIQEETVGTLEEQHRINVLGPGDFSGVTSRGSTVLTDMDASTHRRVEEALQAKTRYGVQNVSQAGGASLAAGPTFNYVRGVGIGLDPVLVSEAKRADFLVIGRVNNPPGVFPEAIDWTLRQLKQEGVNAVIFSGDEVLGFKGYYLHDRTNPQKVTTDTLMRSLGLAYGLVEFGKQKGDVALAKALPEQTVRVHTITGAEMVQATVPDNIQRFLLAARERNIRQLYVRLFLNEPDPVTVNTEYVEKIALGLKKADLISGPAHGYHELATPLWVRGLIGLGTAAAFLLLLDSVTGLLAVAAGRVVVLGAVGGAALLVALPVVGGTTGVKLAALAAACVYPSLALVCSDHLRPSGQSGLGVLGTVLQRFAWMTFVTTLGIAAVVGLLADRLFLIKVDLFMGIKGAQLIPVLVAALVYGLSLRAGDRQPWPAVLDEATSRVRKLASQPLLLWQVAAGFVALIVLFLLVTRSGNDSAVGVSPLELRSRALLDQFLYARPRFKEFLIGHPAMVLGLAFAVRGWRQWAYPLFLVGAIGQVSLLNTFCHLHTPLLVSLWRALLGLNFGVIIGLVLYLLLDNLLLRRLPARASS